MTGLLMTDDLLFMIEDEPESSESRVTPWNVLIVDDEPDVHTTTIHALSSERIHGRPLQFVSAFSAKEAMSIAEGRLDIDLMLLDAVMESEDAGITCACHVREALRRKEIPIIIMRSGFAGLEVERNIDNLTCIDEFVHKTRASRQVLIDVLTKWLGKLPPAHVCHHENG